MNRFIATLLFVVLSAPVAAQQHTHHRKFLCTDRATGQTPLHLYDSTTDRWCAGARINEPGEDVDICIEGDNDASLICTDAGNDRVGISTSTPATVLHVDDASSATTPLVEIEQRGTGDSALQFSIAGDAFALGIDNTTDRLVMSYAAGAGTAVLGTTDVLEVRASGLVAMPINIGADPGAFCTPGTIFIDTDETNDTNCTTTADNALCVCIAADTWAAIEP